jgi:hypothetical protein
MEHMRRTNFLSAFGLIAAGAASTVAAMGATPVPDTNPYPGSSPLPGRSPLPGSSAFPRGIHRGHGTSRPTDLEHIHRHLERLIDMLENYQQTNGAHVSQAIGYLQQADGEIVAQLSSGSPTTPTL